MTKTARYADGRQCSFDDDCESGYRCNHENKLCEIIQDVDNFNPPPPPKQKKKWYETTGFIVGISICALILLIFIVLLYFYINLDHK